MKPIIDALIGLALVLALANLSDAVRNTAKEVSCQAQTKR